MKKLTADDPETRSADVLAGNIQQLRTLFPEASTEGGIDFDVLKHLLGGAVDEREEKYGLNWYGKRRARQAALTPSVGTLRPCLEDSVDWETTRNLMIEGDNLEVLKLLQKSYSGKVKLIYIDPPYNTGKDFIYPDKYDDQLSTYLRYTGQVSEEGFKMSSNTEASGRFHTNWLNMMYPRLRLARTLLREDGVLFVSIDDNEQANLSLLLSEIFGAENHVATFVWKRKAGGGDDSGHVATEHEYVLAFARSADHVHLGNIQHESPAMTAKYNRSENGRRFYLERLDKTSLTYNKSMDFEIKCPDGTTIRPPQPDPKTPSTIWRWSKATVEERFQELIFDRDSRSGEWRIYTKTWESLDGVTPRSLLVEKEHGRNRDGTQEVEALLGPNAFDNPKPMRLLSHLLVIGAPEKDALVLDFFAGAGTTGAAVLAANRKDGGVRRHVLVQLPEPTPGRRFKTISELTAARLRAYGAKLAAEESGSAMDVGFRMFKLDSSNIRAWEPDRSDLQSSLVASVDHLRADRTEKDILYELLLKLGLDLCVPIEKKKISGKDVHSIGGGVLLACLADKITRDQVEPLAKGIVDWHKDLVPAGDTTCVFRDSAFADDVAKTNLAAILNQHGLVNVRSV